MSKAALYFANAAKKVTMQPVVNEVLNERARIRQLQTEINGLRTQLVELLNISLGMRCHTASSIIAFNHLQNMGASYTSIQSVLLSSARRTSYYVCCSKYNEVSLKVLVLAGDQELCKRSTAAEQKAGRKRAGSPIDKRREG